MLGDRQIQTLVRRFYDFAIDEENQVRLSTGVQFDDANQQATIAYFERLALDVRQALARNELDRADNWVTDLLEREGISNELDAVTRAKLQQGLLRASCEVADAMKRRFEGEFSHEPRDALLSHEVRGQLAVASDLPASAGEAVELTQSAPLFSIVASEFREKRLRLKAWEGQTAMQARKTYELFVEVCDDRPLAGYTRQDAARFINLLRELPTDYGKASKYRGMKITDIVEAVRNDASVTRLASRTVQRHHHALSSLWQDQIEAGSLKDTIFGHFRFDSAKQAKDQRSDWPIEKLRKLFASPVWRGCKSDVRRSKRGHEIIRDEKFWIPPIGLYSAMRQEEICQLFLEDIQQENDVWIFDLNDRPPRQLKNSSAKRRVPIHAELIRMGLLDRVRELKSRGEQRLFPKLNPGGPDARYGHQFSKWFTAYRKAIGVYEPSLDFHSLRHTATTLLEQAGVERPIVAALVGHAVPGETARYMKRFTIGQLHQAINKLDPQVDMSSLHLPATPGNS